MDVRKVKVMNLDDRYYQTEMHHLEDDAQDTNSLNAEIQMQKERENEIHQPTNDPNSYTSTRHLGSQAADLIQKI